MGCGAGDDFQATTPSPSGSNGGGSGSGNGSGNRSGNDDGGDDGNQGGTGSPNDHDADGGPASGSCRPGESESCWESAEGDPFPGEAPEAHAICRAGERSCRTDATWGACLGAVGPEMSDSCEPGNDANCNGTENEGCACHDGDEPKVCPNESGCGTQSCSDGAWGTCEGDGETLRCDPDAGDNRQVCGTDGAWTDEPCPAGNVCRDDGTCKLVDGESCAEDEECESESCSSFYRDEDEDGFYANATVVNLCGETNAGYVALASGISGDCNDSNSAVHPGAPEVCDGLDNDCDFNIDNGLPLSGSVVEVGPTSNDREQPEIAWSEEESLYGIVFQDHTATTEGIYFTTFNQAGTVQTAATNVGPSSDGYGLHLVWGTDNFGLTWFSNGDISFRTVSSSGSLGTIRDLINGALARPQVARIGTGNWVVSYISYGTGDGLVGAKTVTPAGVVGSHVNITTENSNTSYLVATSSAFVTAAELDDDSQVNVRNATFTSPVAVSISGDAPILGSGPNGFAVAVQIGGGAQPQIYLFDETGDLDCGPVSFANSSFVASDIAGTAEGYLVVAAGSTVRGQLIAPNCSPISAVLTIDSNSGTAARVSGGSEGWGVVWEAASNTVKRRFFGPKLCD